MDEGSDSCPCVEDTSSSSSLFTPHCACRRDDHGILVHEEECLLYNNATMIYRQDPTSCVCDEPPEGAGRDVCACCSCPQDRCFCKKSGQEALDEWRSKPIIAGALPSVLEANHPLMHKFQENLRHFLEKENAIAKEEILNLKEELRLKKEAYEKDLESIYRSDHDTNQQRVLIEEYEQELIRKRAERHAAEERAKLSTERYKKSKDKLDQHVINEREATEESEALTSLCRQLEQWREDTESDLTVSHRMSTKMKAERRALADEKRQLDMFIYGLSTEVWKLESKLEMFRKQMEVKQNEMDKVNDKVTAYAAELEDLELDKKRLVSLWNSVLVNIQQRDKVYDSVKEDYKALQENYRTLLSNLEITKKITEEEMNKGKEIAMNRDKLTYDMNNATKLYDAEDAKRLALEMQMNDLNECIEMTDRDSELIKCENQTLSKILRNTEKNIEMQNETKLKLENEILFNLQECLLNDKAVENMANNIRKMREASRKQEISLMVMENNHAKIMFDIEVHRNRQARNKTQLEETLQKVQAKEKEVDELEEKYEQGTLDISRKQRELDLIKKKYENLKEVFDMKSPQERNLEDLEKQIKALRDRAEEMQQEWLRMQGHVVRLSSQHQKLVTDVNLINKQIQICEQKTMRIQIDAENIARERARVDRTLRDLQGKLEGLERNRKNAADRNQTVQRATQSVSFEYSASLKDAEAEIIQVEEDIESFETDKMNLTQELDRLQREALIWQRKGMLAMELKKNMMETKSAAGELGQMKAEIHRMTVRKEQLRKIAEKLSEDLAQCVTRREVAMDKSRATAALEKSLGPSQTTSQTQYRHKLRLAKADVARVTKDVADVKARISLAQSERERLENEAIVTSKLNDRLEERVAGMMRECTDLERQRLWLLERVVRSQRIGKELATAIKKQSLKMKKPKATLIEEFSQSRKLNEGLRSIVESLIRDYPYLEDKLAVIQNTLAVYVPEDVPQLSDMQCLCTTEDSPTESTENFAVLCAEKPLEDKSLLRDYPYLEDKLAVIQKLAVYVPEGVPQLSDMQCLCTTKDSSTESTENVAVLCAEKPLED